MRAMAIGGIELVRARVTAGLAERIPVHVERLRWDAGQIAEHQRHELRGLLAHAVEHSPFHARRLGAVDADTFELDDLARLPTMTKDDMTGSFDDLVTDRRLNRRLVEDHLAASVAEPRLLLDDYICLASGGSSGVRGIVVQTSAEYTEFGCSIVRPSFARMMAAGGPPPDGLAMTLVAAASPVHSTGFSSATISEGPLRLRSVPATLPLAEIVERLNAIQPTVLMGYSGKLAELGFEQRAGRLRIAPQAITATSEMLTEEHRRAITDGFGVPIINQFASTEGLVGHSEPGDRVLTFASDTCIVELVDEDDRPVAPGEVAAKALVTNLHNLTQPLIRYELTDRFVEQPPAAAHGHLRATVEGRADEILDYAGVRVHPLAVRSVMVKAAAVREYQVHQTERGADVAVVVEGRLDLVALGGALEESLREAGVPDPHVNVRLVDAIERHPETGKVRRFVPLHA